MSSVCIFSLIKLSCNDITVTFSSMADYFVPAVRDNNVSLIHWVNLWNIGSCMCRVGDGHCHINGICYLGERWQRSDLRQHLRWWGTWTDVSFRFPFLCFWTCQWKTTQESLICPMYKNNNEDNEMFQTIWRKLIH